MPYDVTAGVLSFTLFHFSKGSNRYITAYKKEGSTIVHADASFALQRSARQQVISLLHKYPLTNKERQELLPLTERERQFTTEGNDF